MARRTAARRSSPGEPLIDSIKPPARWPADAVHRRPVSELIPYARNARTHSDAQVAQIAALIERHGWTTPVLVDELGVLIAGHGRVLAAQRLDLISIPAMVAVGWSEDEVKAYRIADNQSALNAGWDDELLSLDLGDLQANDYPLDMLGFADADLNRLLNGDPTEPPGDVSGSGSYQEQYGVIVLCRDEREQRAVFERLQGEGLEVKVVAT